MSENRAVSEKEIDDRLEEILNVPDEKQFAELTHVIKFLALNQFNLRKDYQELYKDHCELKERILDVLKTQEGPEEPIEPTDEKIAQDIKNMFL